MTKLEHALALTERGWPVFPIPRTDRFPTGWHNLASTDVRQIREWWAKNPDANPGVLCGPASGIMVLDVDDAEGFARIAGGLSTLPRTLRVKTGSGRGDHYYFRFQPLHKANWPLPGVGDLKIGDGGGSFVFGPGTTRDKHDGTPYEIVDDAPIAELPPDWLQSLTKARPSEAQTDWSTWPTRIVQGTRNVVLTRWAGYYRGKGLGSREILHLLSGLNQRCDPSLPVSDLRRIAKSAEAWEGPAASGPIEYRSLADLVNDPPVPPQELSTLAWRGDTTVFAGREKRGKSTYATTDACMAAEAGHRVLWINAEEGENIVRHRFVEAQCGAAANVVLPSRRPSSWDELEAGCEQVRPDYLLIDTLASFLGCIGEKIPDHSEGEKWQGVVTRFKYLAERFDCAVVVIHHMTKNSDEVRGSTGITGGVDSVVRLLPVRDPAHRRLDRQMTRWSHPTLEVAFDGARYFKTSETERTVASLEDRILAFIEENAGCSARQIKEHVGGKAQRAQDAIKRLLVDNQIDKRKSKTKVNADAYFISDNY